MDKLDKFLPYGASQDAYYTQTNNSIEAMLKKVGNPAESWLETCGPTSAVTIVHAVLGNADIITPGGWRPQAEDVLTLFLNDPRNANAFRRIRKELNPEIWMGNRIPQYYGLAIPSLFGLPCRFSYGITYDGVKDCIDRAVGVMVCLKKPGHYVAVVGYNDQGLIFNDPWPGNRWPSSQAGKPGFHRIMTRAEFDSNVQPYRVEIG